MATKTENHKNQKTTAATVKKTAAPAKTKDHLEIMDNYLDKRLGWLIWAILEITFLFSLLLFDLRVSLSGDDSFYIIRASDLYTFV